MTFGGNNFNYFPENQLTKFKLCPTPTCLFVSTRRFLWRILRCLGCLCMPLFPVSHSLPSGLLNYHSPSFLSPPSFSLSPLSENCLFFEWLLLPLFSTALPSSLLLPGGLPVNPARGLKLKYLEKMARFRICQSRNPVQPYQIHWLFQVFPMEALIQVFIKQQDRLELYRISAPALANPKSSHFSEIWPSPAPAKYLAGFGRCQCSCSLQYLQLRTKLSQLACQVVNSQR